jgi:hypothetical protein
MRLDKDNIYFLPPNNKNGLSTLPPSDLYLADTFEFRARFTVELKKCNDKDCGIVMLNGKNMGIHYKRYLHNKLNKYEDYLSATVVTEKGSYEKQLNLDTTNVWCRFICDNKNKQITLMTDTQSSTLDFKGSLVDEYKYSYLWVGCGNGFNDPDDEHRNGFFGDITYLEIKKNEKTLFISNFKKKTDFKVFDESGNGNHLLRYKTEWY